MTYQFLLEFLSNTITNLGIQEENRNFELTLDRNSYYLLINDINKFINKGENCRVDIVKTPFGKVDICYIAMNRPYIKLELK